MNKLTNIIPLHRCSFIPNVSKYPKKFYHGTIATQNTNRGNLEFQTTQGEQQEHETPPTLIRLSKRMSELNLCSRREADKLISQSRVLVNGLPIEILGTKVSSMENNIRILDDHFNNVDDEDGAVNHDLFNWEKIRGDTIVLNKPKNYVSGQPDPKHGHIPAVRLLTRQNIFFPKVGTDAATQKELQYTLTSGKYLNFARKKMRRQSRDFDGHFDDEKEMLPSTLLNYAPAGRLDLDSTGALIFTKNGVIAKQILGPNTDKEYIAEVVPVVNITRHERNMGIKALPYPPKWDLGELLRGGRRLWNDRKPMKPVLEAKWVEEGKGENGKWNGSGKIKFVLQEGKKRQIKRMCREMLGLNVINLKRVRVGTVELGDLPEGRWRTLSESEVRGILK
jgi:23S rRNA pseudouridine2604 synthase